MAFGKIVLGPAVRRSREGLAVCSRDVLVGCALLCGLGRGLGRRGKDEVHGKGCGRAQRHSGSWARHRLGNWAGMSRPWFGPTGVLGVASFSEQSQAELGVQLSELSP
jgi:hypothetical protein